MVRSVTSQVLFQADRSVWGLCRRGFPPVTPGSSHSQQKINESMNELINKIKCFFYLKYFQNVGSFTVILRSVQFNYNYITLFNASKRDIQGLGVF